MRPFPVLALVLLIAACGPSEGDPGKAFQDLEARLLAADSLSFDFEVTAVGVIDGDMTGSASLASDGTLTIRTRGTFIGRELQAELTTDADSIRMVTNEISDTVARPADTFRAVVLGLTRMGFLHNLAQLSTASPPEGSEGGFEDSVAAANFSSGPVGDAQGILFDLIVDGEKTSSAGVVLADGLPSERLHTVPFPGSDMVVTERYTNFQVFPRPADQ